MVWNLIGGGAALLSALTLLPQLWKTFRTRRTRDLSFGTLSLITTSNVLWILHGVHRADVALVAANGVLFVCAGVLAVLKVRYDRGREHNLL